MSTKSEQEKFEQCRDAALKVLYEARAQSEIVAQDQNPGAMIAIILDGLFQHIFHCVDCPETGANIIGKTLQAAVDQVYPGSNVTLKTNTMNKEQTMN